MNRTKCIACTLCRVGFSRKTRQKSQVISAFMLLYVVRVKIYVIFVYSYNIDLYTTTADGRDLRSLDRYFPNSRLL